MTDSSPTLRVRLLQQRPTTAGDPRQAFWASLTAARTADGGASELDDREIARLEDHFVEVFPVALLAQMREQAQRESASAPWWSVAARRARRQLSGVEAVRARIVRYDSLVLDLAFAGAAAALIHDRRFLARLTTTWIPQALASAMPGPGAAAMWVDLERGATADAGVRDYGALARATLLVPAIVFAALGFLFFAATLAQRQRLTEQYESLVKSQQAVIDTLSEALADCESGDSGDEPAARFRAKASTRQWSVQRNGRVDPRALPRGGRHRELATNEP